MTSFLKAGDVVLVDLGMVVKVRPAVVLAPRPDRQRNLAIIAPLTSESRGGECEIEFPKPPWLGQKSYLNLAGLASVDHARIQRRLGPFPPDKMKEAKRVLARILELDNVSGHSTS